MNHRLPDDRLDPAEREEQQARELEQAHVDLLQSGSWRRLNQSAAADSGNANLSSAEALLVFIERVRRGGISRDSQSPATPAGQSKTETIPTTAERPPTSHTRPGLASLSTPSLGSEWHNVPQRIGRFEIERVLGRGGFGVVFAAFDPQLGRRVALKVPRPDALASDEGQARFLREAKAAALLGHPHIVTVYESGRAGPVLYIAYELVDGIALSTWLESHRQALSFFQMTELMVRLTSAIQHAHSRSVLHRDLKPANVLIAWPAAKLAESESMAATTDLSAASIADRVKISDFGMAQLADEDFKLTWTGSIIGTPAYLAPEQLQPGRSAHPHATDIYGLGAVLYELLTGRPPFSGTSLASVVRAVEQDEPVRPRKIEPRVPKDLEAICLKCLEKKPERRYGSAVELGDDLKRVLEGEPILARPAGLAERSLKWCRRHPWVAIFLASLMVSSVSIALLWFRAEGHRRRAETQAQNAQTAQQSEAQERKRLERVLYAHDLSLAQHEYTQNYTERAALLLAACPPYLRHWEWRYLQQICQHEVRTLRELGEPSSCVALSRDGHFVAAGTGYWGVNRPGVLNIWDTSNGELIHSWAAHPSSILDLDFSPDGTRLLSTGSQWHGATPPCGLIVWDLASGEKVWNNPDVNCHAAAYSPDGAVIACGMTDGRLFILDAQSGQVLAESRSHTKVVLDLAFSPDGKFLATAGRDGTVSIRDMAAGQEIHSIQKLADARRVCYAPTSREFAVSLYSGVVKIFEHLDGEIVETYSFRSDQRPQALEYTPDGLYLVMAVSHGGIKFVDPKTARTFRELRGHNGDISEIAFSADGQQMATSGHDGNVKIWDVTKPEYPDTHRVNGAFFIDLHDAHDGEHVVVAMGFNSSGATQSNDKTIKLWNIAQKRAALVFHGHDSWPTSLAVAAKQRRIVSGAEDGIARVWDSNTGAELHTLIGHRGRIVDVAFARGGEAVVTADQDQTLRLWQAESGKLIQSLRVDAPIQCIACPPRQPVAVCAAADGRIVCWHLDSNQVALFAKPSGSAISCIAFDPAGDFLATGNAAHAIELWNWAGESTASRKEPKFVMRGHTEPIQSISFSDDGLRLISTSMDRSIRIWDVESGEELLGLSADSGQTPRVVFGPGPDRVTYVSRNAISHWGIDSRSDQPDLAQQSEWHRRELSMAESRENWMGVAFHAEALAAIDTNPLPLRARSGWARARLGQWEEAIAEFDDLVAQGGSIRIQTTFAFLHWAKGDGVAFQKICAETLAKNREPPNETDANYLAWMCALAPGIVPSHPESITLAERGASVNLPDQLNTLGAVYCRAGQFARAIETLQRSIALRDQVGVPHDWIFLALSYLGSGDKEQARLYLRKSQDWLATQTESLRNAQPVDAFLSWRTKVELEHFIREVERGLADGPATTD